MATVPLNINNATPPYTISVKKTGEGYERFRGWSSNILLYEPATDGVDAQYNVVVTDSANPPCTIRGDFHHACGGSVECVPQVTATLEQPYCTYQSNNVANGVMKLRNVVNAVRYVVCYNETYNCGCTSTGLITGDTDIELISPQGANSQSGIVRVFCNSGCDDYLDIPFSISGPGCNLKRISLLNIDYRTVVTADSGNDCNSPVVNDYDMYITLNTPGVAENGQRALTRGGAQRNVPNGNDTPNVFITAALDLSYGPGAFYRWAINFAYLRGKYPGIQNFTFDVYAKKTKSTKQTSVDPQYNFFSGVAMTYLAPQTGCTSAVGGYRNSTDNYRQPNQTTQSGVQLRTGTLFSTVTTEYIRINTFTVDVLKENISTVNDPVTWTKTT